LDFRLTAAGSAAVQAVGGIHGWGAAFDLVASPMTPNSSSFPKLNARPQL
jgi:formylmethanofuran:tetrahydromethanopterin formyltransferase